MFGLISKQQEYEKQIRKYSDTVMILSAVYSILKQQPLAADYVGVETRILSEKGQDIEPDLTAMYDSRKKGLLFEFKWSLPFSDDWLKQTIHDLKDYSGQCANWKNSTGKVDYHDLILVCHMEDTTRATETIAMMSSDPQYAYLISDGFAVWSWIISPSRRSLNSENLILTRQYGKIRHVILDDKTKPPSGLVLPQESLTYLRSSFHFIKMKPPVQYTIIKLIMHVFSQFQDSRKGKDYYELTTDMIYDKAKTVFFPWRDMDVETVQAKRNWIVDALETMYALKMIGKTPDKTRWVVPIPTIRPRGPLQEAICRKLAKHSLKNGTPKTHKRKNPKLESKPRSGLKATTLMDFK